MKLKAYLTLFNIRPSAIAEGIGHAPAVITEYLNTLHCEVCQKEIGKKNLSLPISLKIQNYTNGLVRCEDLLVDRIYSQDKFNDEEVYFCSEECHRRWKEG